MERGLDHINNQIDMLTNNQIALCQRLDTLVYQNNQIIQQNKQLLELLSSNILNKKD